MLLVRSLRKPYRGTLGDVDALARQVAAGLRARGVQPGDAIAFQLPNWLEAAADGNRLTSETRVQAYGAQGRLGLAAVRPLVASFHARIGTDGLAAALRRAERARPDG